VYEYEIEPPVGSVIFAILPVTLFGKPAGLVVIRQNAVWHADVAGSQVDRPELRDASKVCLFGVRGSSRLRKSCAGRIGVR
jgi:hypothetical protein